MDLKWFNISPDFFKLFGQYIKLYNCFNRVSNDGHFGGVGILQVGRRHLFFVGSVGISILFIGETK